MPGRVDLVLERQFGSLGERGVQDHGIRPRDEKTSGLSAGIPMYLSPRWVRRVFGVADGPQCGTVEHRSVIQMQYEHRRIRRGGVDLFEGRHAPFGELKLA